MGGGLPYVHEDMNIHDQLQLNLLYNIFFSAVSYRHIHLAAWVMAELLSVGGRSDGVKPVLGRNQQVAGIVLKIPGVRGLGLKVWGFRV